MYFVLVFWKSEMSVNAVLRCECPYSVTVFRNSRSRIKRIIVGQRISWGTFVQKKKSHIWPIDRI